MTAQVLCGPRVYAVAAQARQGECPHRSVTWLFALAFETTSNYSILNFLPQHLFLCPCSLQDTTRKGHVTDKSMPVLKF